MRNCKELVFRCSLAGGLFALTLFYDASLHAQSSECRTASLPDGTPALFCKDKKGNWQQQQGKVAVAPAAPPASPAQELYADASYRGPAAWFVPVQQRQSRPRGLTDLILKESQPKTERSELFVSVTMRIEGEKISGTITGGSWRVNVPFTGTRRNGICDLAATYNGETVSYIGPCDQNAFAGKLKGYFPKFSGISGEFNLGAVSFADTSARDSRRAELEAKCNGGNGSVEACVELDQLK